MTQGCRDATGDQLGKTILFARNHKHAQFIQDRFDHHDPHLAGKAARVIDNQSPYAQSLIDEFSNPNSELVIAISVDMLDTGIDIPEIVNLMLLKPVRSKTKFWQMVGRGTRLCPNLFGPGHDKECFWIFDCCQTLEYRLGGGGAEGTAKPESLSTKLFKARLALIDTIDQQAGPQAKEASLPSVAENLSHRQSFADSLRGHVAACTADNFLVRPHLDLLSVSANPRPGQPSRPMTMS